MKSDAIVHTAFPYGDDGQELESIETVFPGALPNQQPGRRFHSFRFRERSDEIAVAGDARQS